MSPTEERDESTTGERPLSECEALLSRSEQIKERLSTIALPPQPSPAPRVAKDKKSVVLDPNRVPFLEKTDTHWDFVLKEMQWLSTDFTSERKRHSHSRRKLANGVRQYFKTRESRALAALAQAELKRRRLALKMNRNVGKWWKKMDKIVTYQQKLIYDQERHQAMNRKLVKLVQQTETYTKSLVHGIAGNKQRSNQINNRKRERPGKSQLQDGFDYDKDDEYLYQVSIEEALAVGQRKRKVHDYARLAKLERDYSTEQAEGVDDSGSDSSFGPDGESSDDDETCLEPAEDQANRNDNNRQRDFEIELDGLEPTELQKLQEEATMDIESVLERLRQEPPTLSEAEIQKLLEEESSDEENAPNKRVQFSSVVEVKEVPPREELESSEAMAEDKFNVFSTLHLPYSIESREVTDYQGDVKELGDTEQAVDDDRKMEGEERLPQEMAPQGEVALLQQKNELTMEQSRAKYAAADQPAQLGFTSFQGENVETCVASEVSDDRVLEVVRGVSTVGEVSERVCEYGQAGGANPPQNSKIEDDVVVGGTMVRASSSNESKTEDENGSGEPPSSIMGANDERVAGKEEKLAIDSNVEENFSSSKCESNTLVQELKPIYPSIQQEKATSNDGSHVEDQMRSLKDVKTDSQEIAVNRAVAPRRSRRMRKKAKTRMEKVKVDEDDDAEFVPVHGVEVDDETTMEAEEKLGRDMSYEEELAMLNQENEMSVEELRAMYASAFDDQQLGTSPLASEHHNAEEFVANNEGDYANTDLLGEPDGKSGDRKLDDDSPDTSKRKRMSDSEQDNEKKHRKVDRHDVGSDALTALEQSTELAKSTLATRPYMLASWVRLREYQQIGLNWLVSMQTRRLNGILADEMGLGKTLQTIALIAYLASYKGIWGPHLIVVPTSVMVNWETEFKRFSPGLKVLCYYGSAKRRKELRTGWTKTNWNHVVITSYQLAVQDAFAFKRKRWYYMVLDEAQNIKNFQSQRWQTLINFNTQRRLLLTGTPLQNSLMELWSLLHFLMPYIFRSRKEFSFWFENPMNNMIEGTTNENASVINRLHGIIRPFVLRRLKKDVETQMPGKFEHIVKCSLSRRQMLMYEEFMARSSTRKALGKGGNFLGMMNVLMQLRKVCNHPDLFEPRSVVTPFVLDPVDCPMPACVFDLTNAISFLDSSSAFLRIPLWCGSGGDPSIMAAWRHDAIESDQLRHLEKGIPMPLFKSELLSTNEGANQELLKLETELEKKRFEDRVERTKFLNSINSWRCQAPRFAYPTRLLNRLDFLNCDMDSKFSTLETPAQIINIRKSQQGRADECDEMIKKFVFCVPKAGLKASSNSSAKVKSFEHMLLEPVEEYMSAFKRARARLSSFFPDKKLVQFDSGKLQTLSELLRELKRGGHRTLIFTQMSKMLDILEAFLNLNGHTYMRLDGSTGVTRRQMLMDRFNNDPKIFCFILSTRSGGTGVNLIGADTVVFYDSDWNPAMDAQAQDRVHRIGQTRDCHVYRLVTEHTIEENILIKAKQKKNLDILVMDRGKFDSSHLFSHDQSARLSSENSDSQDMRDVYTKGGLLEILGVTTVEEEVAKEDSYESADDDKKDMTNEQMENAMATLEDDDDAEALRGARKEAAEELQEFDEAAEVKESEHEDSVGASLGRGDDKKEKEIDNRHYEESEEKELEKEFESWQTSVGMDKDAIEASLSPVERYGFHFRTERDPFVSLYAVLEYRRKAEEVEEEDGEIDIDEIERKKLFEERQAFVDGDLLGTFPNPAELIRHRNLFQRESARLRTTKKTRTLTGDNWETRVDARQKKNFWYNVDTGEAIWDKPRVLIELEEYGTARTKKWCALPRNALVHAFSFLQPYPDRLFSAARVCRQWYRAASDPSFILHVYPVEMGAYTRDERKIEKHHFRTIQDAVLAASPGDTIELGDGHYWVNRDIDVSIPLRIVGDDNNPSNVVVEMSGSCLNWRALGGWIEGITFRRPKLNATSDPVTKSLFQLSNGRLNVFQCAFDNEGSEGHAIVVSGTSAGIWENVAVNGGILEESRGSLKINEKFAR